MNEKHWAMKNSTTSRDLQTANGTNSLKLKIWRRKKNRCKCHIWLLIMSFAFLCYDFRRRFAARAKFFDSTQHNSFFSYLFLQICHIIAIRFETKFGLLIVFVLICCTLLLLWTKICHLYSWIHRAFYFISGKNYTIFFLYVCALSKIQPTLVFQQLVGDRYMIMNSNSLWFRLNNRKLVWKEHLYGLHWTF